MWNTSDQNRLKRLERAVSYLACKVKNGGGGGGTEIDPVFTASPAYNITQNDIDFWNSGGGIPTLQQVSDSGNTTSKSLKSLSTITASSYLFDNGVQQNTLSGNTTANRTWAFPDKSGTVAMLSDVVEKDRLRDVTSRGNYTPTPISFLYEGSDPSTGVGGKEGAIGIHTPTFSYYFGGFNTAATGQSNLSIHYGTLGKLTTGTQNIAMGLYTGASLTTGSYNTFVGSSSAYGATTGNFNTFFGDETGFKTTTGYRNTFLGHAAGFNTTTGSLNVVVGQKAANTTALGDRNTIIGTSAGQGLTGSNNVLIGVGSGYNDGAISNKLIIHSNPTFVNYSNTADGAFSSAQQSTLSRALITGDFNDRWVKFNGGFIINPTYLPNAQGDSTFTKTLVIKDDGTIGSEPKTGLVLPYVPKVTIKSFSMDSTNFYLRVWVAGIIGGYKSPPFRIFADANANYTEAVNITIEQNSVAILPLPTNPTFPSVNSIYFTLTFPRSSNPGGIWTNNVDSINITAMFIGAHNQDVAENIVYSIPRVGLDTQIKQSITI